MGKIWKEKKETVMVVSEEMRKIGFRSIIQIKGDVRSVQGEEVFYRLYEIKRASIKSYAINVSNDSENEVYPFGNIRSAAMDIFRIIVESTVTPCTLKYISEDFNSQRRERR